MIVTGAQIIAARALLRCSQAELAEMAGVSEGSVRNYEAMEVIERTGHLNCWPYALWLIECALLKAGVMPILEPAVGIRFKVHGNEKLHGVAEWSEHDSAANRELCNKYAQARARPRYGVVDNQAKPKPEAHSSNLSCCCHGVVAEPKRPSHMLCLARTRRGTQCACRALENGRCKLHGGKSTGATTPKGRAGLADQASNRWDRQRAAGITAKHLVSYAEVARVAAANKLGAAEHASASDLEIGQ